MTYAQTHYVKAIRAGICGTCFIRPHLEGRVLCRECRARQTRNNRAKYARKRRRTGQRPRLCSACRKRGHYAKACDALRAVGVLP